VTANNWPSPPPWPVEHLLDTAEDATDDKRRKLTGAPDPSPAPTVEVVDPSLPQADETLI
jgi:hypothetical protein